MRLIEDFSERMRVSPNARVAWALHDLSVHDIVSDFDDTTRPEWLHWQTIRTPAVLFIRDLGLLERTR